MAKKSDYTIIGIDGGGTRTRGVIYRNKEILAQSNAGTTRIGAVGVGESCERLLNVIADLCEKANIDSEEIDAVVIGQAGVWLEDEKKRSTHLLKTLARSQKMTLNDLIVTSDAELAVEGAFNGKNGIVLIVGTGSIAIGRTGKNKFVRSGGWGIELDDEGSGAWIGKEGLTAAVRGIDGRDKHTAFTDALAELFPTIDLKNPRTIVKAYSERNFEYHMLTPTVMQCAEDGDEKCLDIIERAAFHLMELLEALLKHYTVQTVPVALMGGIIDADTLLAQKLIQRIKAHERIKYTEAKRNAIDGALRIGEALLADLDKL